METEEEYARRLLGPLAGEVTTPSTVDLDQAILVGRRRRLGHRVATGTALAVATAVVVAVVPMVVNRGLRGALPQPGTLNSPTPTASPSPTPFERPPTPALPTSCSVTGLPTPKGTLLSSLYGSDTTGRYAVGEARLKSGNSATPVIWDGEQVTAVPIPGMAAMLRSVNSHGTAVGRSLFKGHLTAWIYENGVVRQLPSAGMDTSPSSINDNGVIVGSSYGPNIPITERTKSKALVWWSSTSTPVVLPLPAGVEHGHAADVDTDGTIVGGFTDANHKQVAYVWMPDGTGYPLAKPLVSGKLPASSGVEFIREGWVVGTVEGVSGDGIDANWAARWDLRTGQKLAFRDLPVGANDVNRVGMFVATDGKGRAVLSNGANTLTLPDLSPRTALKAGLANVPRSVSDDGRTIFGEAIDITGNQQAVIWHCQ